MLVHIGFHKTGTTFLQRRVFNQPSLGFDLVWSVGNGWPAEHFVLTDAYSFEPEAVRTHFEECRADPDLIPVISHEILSGNEMQGKYHGEMVAGRLAQTFPNARILIGIREQVGMVLSLYGQYIRDGGVYDLHDFFKVEVDRPGFRSICRPEHLEYHRTYRHYEALFGAENVCVLPIELLARDPQSYLDRLGRFCDLPTLDVGDMAPANKRSSRIAQGVELRLNRIIRHPVNTAVEYRKRPVLFRAKKKIVRWVNAMSSARGKDGQADREMLTRDVGGFFAASNRELAEATGLPLADLGYRVDA